ncbi:MAG: hypothetical protein Q8N45_06390, partial [Anaerolineales bacterium]|nr:hypothetical protein [Anaerolineales bacterium]
ETSEVSRKFLSTSGWQLDLTLVSQPTCKTSEFSENSEVFTDAFNDLNEALNTAFEGGYRIYEADIRVALAWAYIADLTPGPSPTLRLRSGQAGRGESLAKAKAEASRALQMSAEMGYYWGKVDAEEVLKVISDQ